MRAVCHRRSVRWFSVVLAIVGCHAAPPPAPPPSAPPPAPRPPPEPVSCADAGVILRGSVEDSKKAGPAKEAAIASACRFDRWSREVLDCIGGELLPLGCLHKLTAEQRAALDTKLTAWTSTYPDETWETAEDERIANTPPPVACSSIINTNNAAWLAPALVPTGEEREFAASIRRFQVIALCDQWPNEVRLCLHNGGTFTTCRAKLDAAQEQALAGRLAMIDGLMAKIAALKPKPASFECKPLVAKHYADAAWVGKAELPKNPKATRAELVQQAADRKAMIAESRKRMLDACTGEGWSATLRACEHAGGGELCAQGAGRAGTRWGFPASGVLSRTGIAECDGYGATIQALMTCSAIPQQAKDAIKQSYEQMRAGMGTSLTGDAKKAAGTACKQADEGLRQAMTSMGCVP